MIAKDKKIARILGFAAPMALLVGLGASTQALADMPYAHTARDNAVTNDFGECWQSADGKPNLPPCVTMLDSDGDGVPDDKDQCPDTPAGVEVDEVGCPLDTDGDGVPDYKDKCPGTPAGAKVDADGCEIVADITIDLVNDEFDFDSAKLKPAMKAALDDVAARIAASKGDEHLVIIGHTDSIGSEAYNQGLSERRAQATADYLIDAGVMGSHVTTKGMGESQPVADNGTDAGRAKNRRVEILTQ